MLYYCENLGEAGTLFLRRPGFIFITDRKPVQPKINRLFFSSFREFNLRAIGFGKKEKPYCLFYFLY